MRFNKLCVVGLGYIGLPTASTFAANGLDVLGADINRRLIDGLRAGETMIEEPGLRTLVQAALQSGKLQVAETPAAADAFIIAVPTPITPEHGADLDYVDEAAKSIVPHLQPGNLVILESTVPPRTTVDRLPPLLEAGGLKVGADIMLAYSPERVLPGRILHEMTENARVIGGYDRASAEAGKALYRVFVRGEILLTDATTAEYVKLMENTYRDVNIALANEFGQIAEQMEIDVWRAIELANLHPRVEILRPGPGVGGHCIGVDPWFLVEAAPELTALIEQARRVNDAQPGRAVDRIREALSGELAGRRIAALGLAYKADVDDLRQSPAVEIVTRLVEAGAEVRTFEPVATEAAVDGAFASDNLQAALEEAEAVVLLVNHRQLVGVDPQQAASWMPGRVAVDLRHAWDPAAWSAAGFKLHVLGVGAHDN